MGPRLSKNILEIQQIESGTLAKFWSDGRSVTKVKAIFFTPERIDFNERVDSSGLSLATHAVYRAR